jgi:hypothetical protein
MVDQAYDADGGIAVDAAAARRHTRRIRTVWLVACAITFALGVYLSAARDDLFGSAPSLAPASHHGVLANIA